MFACGRLGSLVSSDLSLATAFKYGTNLGYEWAMSSYRRLMPGLYWGRPPRT